MVKKILNIAGLIEFLKPESLVYIQTHNYPDHDAVASAFALQRLFKHYEIASKIVYVGEVGRGGLWEMMQKLDIVAFNADDCSEMTAEHKIVIVDGCKGSRNVLDLIGDEVGVIDHHRIPKDEIEDVGFVDIREWLGSCSALMALYYDELGVEISDDVATALQIGINMDTANLTRAVHKTDLHFFNTLYFKSHQEFVNSVLRNYLTVGDLAQYRHLIDFLRVTGKVGFCYFPAGCPVSLLGILSDFTLALREVEFVLLCAVNDGQVYMSLRSEHTEWNASLIVQELLRDIGSGGGHSHMAGGVVFSSSDFDVEAIHGALLRLTGEV